MVRFGDAGIGDYPELRRVTTTLHLTPRECWESQMADPTYLPDQFEREGFIHCTNGEANLTAVGNRYYVGDSREMVCLVIELSALAGTVKYEDEERIFPHIYGPLNCDAVVGVRSAMRDADGNFLGFGLDGG